MPRLRERAGARSENAIYRRLESDVEERNDLTAEHFETSKNFRNRREQRSATHPSLGPNFNNDTEDDHRDRRSAMRYGKPLRSRLRSIRKPRTFVTTADSR